MNKFRNLGFIDYNKNLEVRSSLLSVMLHEQGSVVGGWLIPPMKKRTYFGRVPGI